MEAFAVDPGLETVLEIQLLAVWMMPKKQELQEP